jgi:hypothetical protein
VVVLLPRQGSRGNLGHHQCCSPARRSGRSWRCWRSLHASHHKTFVALSIVTFLSIILLLMQFFGTPCNLIMEGEETLGEEVSEAKCLCDEFKIAKHFFCVLDSIFSTLDMIPSFISRERNKIIFLYIKR